MPLSIRTRTAFTSDTRAATAIEYAILASLVGLGIVGSLVTTRASLSTTFGAASTQMQSSTSTTSPAVGATPSNPIDAARAAVWSAKTLASQSFDPAVDGTSLQRLRAVYSDGTTAVVDYGGSTTFPYQVIITDPATKTVTHSYFDQDRKQNYFQIQQMDDNMNKIIRADVASMPGFKAFPGSPAAVQNHEVYTYNNGAMSSYSTTALDAAWVAKAQTGQGDFSYFDALKPKS